MGGGARRSQCSPRRRIRRGNVSSAVRVLSNRLVGFSGAFRRVTTPEPTPTLRRVFSAAQSGAREFVAQIDRPSLESRTVESTRRRRAGRSKAPKPIPRGGISPPGFKPRDDARAEIRMDKQSPSTESRSNRPRARLGQPRALTRTRESRTPAIALSRRKPRERRHAGDADALAEGTASVPRARRAKARGARTAGCVLSRRHAMTISGTRLSASVRGLARAHLARRAGGRALGTRAAIRRIDTPHGGGGEKKGVTFKEPLDIDRSACVTGIMHVGVGGFHRAHQLVRDASSPSARRELPRARARRPRNPKERWMIPPKRSEHRPTRRIRQLSLDAGGAAASEPRDEEGASRPSAARNAERGNRSARYARLERSVPTAPAPLARVAAASRGPSRVTHEVQGRKRPSHPRFRPVHEEPAHVFFPASKLSPALAGSLPPGRLTLFPEPPLPRPRRRRTLLDQKKSPT